MAKKKDVPIKNIVIYARYSSDKQTEQSIEGQLKVCYDYAKTNGYTVIHEYLDPAMTGRKDNRPQFQQMIHDSSRGDFQAVLVYSLDRFSRDRYDNIIYKRILKDNGVRVLSARENISEDPEGVLLESVLEGLSEFYSLDLGKKVRRGMKINAEKGKSTGGTIAFGYKSVDKELVIDEDKAPYVQKIYEMYAEGYRAVDIVDYLNERNIRTASGVAFNRNSLHSILKNKKYIGIFQYGDSETEECVPRIISDELFYRVAEIMERNKQNAGHNKAKTEYLLTTKLFCGHCRAPMVGVSAKSKTGRIYYYYSCNTSRIKGCHKKNVRKELIEGLVLKKCRELLTDENIKMISTEVAAICRKMQNTDAISVLQRKIRQVDKAIENLVKALEGGMHIDIIGDRITENRNKKEILEKELHTEKRKLVTLSELDIQSFLTQIKNGDLNDIKYQKTLIKIFVNSIYLFDDELTIIFNAGEETVAVDGILLDEIAESNSDAKSLYSDACGSPKP